MLWIMVGLGILDLIGGAGGFLLGFALLVGVEALLYAGMTG